MGVLARRGTVGGEDSCAVAVGVPVDHTDGIIEGVCLQNHQHRPEDLFSVALHVRLPEHKHSHGGDVWGVGVIFGVEKTHIWRHLLWRCWWWWDPQSSRSRNLWLWHSGRPAASLRPGPRRSGSDCRLSPWLAAISEAQHLHRAGLLTGSRKSQFWGYILERLHNVSWHSNSGGDRGTLRHSLKNGYFWVSWLLIQIPVRATRDNQSQFYLTLIFFKRISSSKSLFWSVPQIWPQICSVAHSTSSRCVVTTGQKVWLGRCGWPWPDQTKRPQGSRERERERQRQKKGWRVEWLGVAPAFTCRALARSTSSGNQLLASPTRMAVDRAMQRCPAAPNAAPTSWFRVFSLLASGITTPWFLAPWCVRDVVSSLPFYLHFTADS